MRQVLRLFLFQVFVYGVGSLFGLVEFFAQLMFFQEKNDPWLYSIVCVIFILIALVGHGVYYIEYTSEIDFFLKVVGTVLFTRCLSMQFFQRDHGPLIPELILAGIGFILLIISLLTEDPEKKRVERFLRNLDPKDRMKLEANEQAFVVEYIAKWKQQ